MLKEVVMSNLKTPSQHLTGGTENYQKIPYQNNPFSNVNSKWPFPDILSAPHTMPLHPNLYTSTLIVTCIQSRQFTQTLITSILTYSCLYNGIIVVQYHFLHTCCTLRISCRFTNHTLHIHVDLS
jgi:hypothetical protein